jgi:hypothetical protein
MISSCVFRSAFDSTYFQWLKDGTTLMATSNKFRTLGDDKHSTLVIKQFNEYDEGTMRVKSFGFVDMIVDVVGGS